jgi:UDP-GlcNAc3NAcA epimerase
VIEHRIIHTGQHYDREMAELFFVQLRIPEPDYTLEVGSGSHGKQIARILERMEPALLKERPDWVVVYGDTNSTLAGALLAARMFIPLAHVEAGCRSYNRRMPEEQNRVVTDHLSQLLLAPTQSTVENLWREGIGLPNDPLRRTVAFTGDIMYDALLANLRLAERRIDENLEEFGLEKDRFYLLTLHRAENTDCPERLRSIVQTLEALDLPVLFPVHPRTRKVLSAARISLDNGNIRIVPPIGYLDMLALEKNARKILTDSGGVQKEAFYLKVPCVTLRDETEWPETVELGLNQTTGVDRKKILEAVRAPHPNLERSASTFGTGEARKRILDELLSAGTGQPDPSDS